MTSRSLLMLSFLILVGTTAALAEATDVPAPAMYMPPAASVGEITPQTLLADRVSFVKEAYALNDEQSNKVVPLLEQLVPSQERYDLKVRRTLRRTALAISVAANAPPSPETDQGATMVRLEEQIKAMHAEAPLSLANVIKLVDPLLPKEQVEAAHNRIKAKLGARLQQDTPTVNLERIDYLLVPAVIPRGLPSIQAPPTPPQTAPPSALPPQSTTPPAQPYAKAAPPPPPPPQPPKPLQAAPPEAVWTADHEAIVTKYQFTNEQKKIAEFALSSCLARAAAHRERSKAEYQRAQGLTDQAARDNAIKALNKPLDKLYDELIQRTESIGTMEQKLRAEGKLSIPPRRPSPTAQPPGSPSAPSASPVSPRVPVPPPAPATSQPS